MIQPNGIQCSLSHLQGTKHKTVHHEFIKSPTESYFQFSYPFCSYTNLFFNIQITDYNGIYREKKQIVIEKNNQIHTMIVVG